MSKERGVNYRPWEEDQGHKRKKKAKARGIPHKTAIKSRTSSMPGGESHEYLKMFILVKERERLAQYGELLSQQHEAVIKEWNTLKEKLIALEKKVPRLSEDSGNKSAKKTKKGGSKTEKKMKNMKVMDWHY